MKLRVDSIDGLGAVGIAVETEVDGKRWRSAVRLTPDDAERFALEVMEHVTRCRRNEHLRQGGR